MAFWLDSYRNFSIFSSSLENQFSRCPSLLVARVYFLFGEGEEEAMMQR